MKKTSKKFLSLFLALVMIITSCSVGFTAFAADKNKTDSNNDYWSNGTDATAAYSSLNDLVDEYIPQLLNIPKVKSLLEDKLGMTVTSSTTIKDLVVGVSPTVLGALGSSANIGDVLGENANAGMNTNFNYAYLNGDGNNAMNFYALYKFCSQNQNSSNEELKKYARETLPKLTTLRNVFTHVQTDRLTEFATGYDKYENEYAQAVPTETKDGIVTKYDIENAKYKGTKIKDIKDPELDIVIKYMNTMYKVSGADDGVKTLADALYLFYGDGIFDLTAKQLLGLTNMGGLKITDEEFGGTTKTVLTPKNYLKVLRPLFPIEQFCTDNGQDYSKMSDTDKSRWEEYRDINISMTVYAFFTAQGTQFTQEYNQKRFPTDYYSEYAKGVLVASGLYKNSKEIDDKYNITKEQMQSFLDYVKDNKPNGDETVYFAQFLNSSSCTFSTPAKEYLRAISDHDDYKQYLIPFVRLAQSTDKVDDLMNWKYTGSYKMEYGSLTDDLSFVDLINYMVPGYVVKTEFAPAANQSSPLGTVFGAYDCSVYLSSYIEFVSYYKDDLSKYSYNYNDYKIPDSLIVYATNSLLNDKIVKLLEKKGDSGNNNNNDGGFSLDSLDIGGIISSLFETDIDVAETLKDIWLDLYNDPVATIFKLLPTITIALDELVVPLLFNADDDAKPLLDLYGILCTGKGILTKYSQSVGDTEVGIGALRFDLNKIVPGILHWLLGDKDEAYFKDMFGYYDEAPYNTEHSDIPRFTNIYVADKALYGAHLNGGLAKALINKKKEECAANNTKYDSSYDKTAKGIDEIVTELASFATQAVEQYLADQKENPDLRYNAEYTAAAEVTQKGLNNIFVALPEILDNMGKNFIAKYNIKSDWTYLYNGKMKNISKTFTNGTVNQKINANLQAFKDTATGKNADGTFNSTAVLDSFVDTLVGNWLNAIIDLLNDTLSDENNDITSKLPLVQGLLDSLGGLGEKSIITDVLNGLFQLKRTDTASFTLKQRETTKFRGFSNESGFYLLSNLQFKKDGESRGIIPVVMTLIKGSKTKNSYNVGNALGSSAKGITPYLTASKKSAAGTDYSKLLSKTNTKNAQALIDALDKLLSSLLANTSINGFDLDSTENLLSGLVSFASGYFGGKNTNDVVRLLNNYLYFVSGESKVSPSKKGQVGTKATKSGDVNAKQVYTSANLSNLVIQTYSLIENVVDYVFYNGETGVLKSKDPNMLIGDAVYGLISPDAVAVRLSDDYSKTADILKGEDYRNWNSFKVEITAANTKSSSWKKDYLKFGFKNGDKKAFYDALGESVSGIASIVSVLLTRTQTDNNGGNYYSAIVQPVMNSIAKATGASGVISASQFNKLSAPDQLITGILTPMANIVDKMYDAPVSFLLNVVKGLAGVLDDKHVTNIVNAAITPIDKHITGLIDIVKYLSPTFADVIANVQIAGKDTKKDTTDDKFLGGGIRQLISLPKKNVLVTAINGLIGGVFTLPNINWSKLANASSPAEVLLLVYGYVVDTVLTSDQIMALLDGLNPAISKILKNLSAAEILNIVTEVINSVQNPTDVYWTFSEYASKFSKSFTYPTGITSSDANDAVKQLDSLVENVFPLLNSLGVTDIKGLGALVNDNLYTNENLTKLATTLYGALDGNDTVANVFDAIGIDVSTKGIAHYLTDKSYGRTYSTAAATLKKTKSWKKVKSLNWGFSNGSSKAKEGFVNGLAAVLRPLNDVLSIFLAEGTLSLKNTDLKGVLKAINVKGSTNIAKGSEYGCKLTYIIKNGVVELDVRSNVKTGSNHKNVTNVVKFDLNSVINQIQSMIDKNSTLNFGTNGYESAIIPVLEAFMCDNVKTYSQYKKDYKKAKDNLLINIFNPIVSFVGDAVDAPFDTISKVLPNVAYFIESNGIAQVVGNLLAPITAKNGILGILSKHGINVDKIIKQLTGGDLGELVTNLLDLKVDFHLELTHLEKCNIQDIIVPLVNSLIKKTGIKIPSISFAKIASLGTISTKSSAAKNANGKYTTKQVKADQGKVLITVLRYLSKVLNKNHNAIKKIILNIETDKKKHTKLSANKTVSSILTVVFNQLGIAGQDDLVHTVFYLLNGQANNVFFDYTNFKYKDSSFTFGDLDEDFCRTLAPMLDGLVTGLLTDKGGLLGLVTDMVYKDDIISSLAVGLYKAVEGVKINDSTSLTSLLAQTGIDFSTSNVASLLTNEKYGKTYAAAASVIKNAGSWSKVNKNSLVWGVTDRQSFLHALTAVLRPVYGVLDVLLNSKSLGLFNLISVPGSDGYSSVIVPLLEAFGCYNVKTQYQYREDVFNEYDNILLDILNPLMDKVEDILLAPVETLADILPNLALFFANDGLLQVIDNLLTAVSSLLDSLKSVVDVNALLKALNFDLNKLTAKAGLNLGIKLNIYDLKGTLKPLIGADNVVGLINKILPIIKIKGSPLGLELPEIDWLELASHGKVVLNAASQAATHGSRIYVKSDQDETLIAVLRYLIDTINYKGNYDIIVKLIGGLIGGADSGMSDTISQVLGMVKGDSDTVIKNLVDLLQSLA